MPASPAACSMCGAKAATLPLTAGARAIVFPGFHQQAGYALVKAASRGAGVRGVGVMRYAIGVSIGIHVGLHRGSQSNQEDEENSRHGFIHKA